MKFFHPDKVNYGAYGDTVHHHLHVVSKYKDGYEWGWCIRYELLITRLIANTKFKLYCTHN